jgi:hypothetical protein
MRMGTSIKSLMLLIALVAATLVALRSTLEIWASAFYTLTLALLCTAIPALVYRQAEKRAFWIGFAAFGWGYIVMCFGAVPPRAVPTLLSRTEPPPLLTTKLLEWAYPYLRTVPPGEAIVIGKANLKDTRNIVVTSSTMMGGIRFFRSDPEDFLRVGHSILSLVIALAGGIVGRFFFFAARSEREGGGSRADASSEEPS